MKKEVLRKLGERKIAELADTATSYLINRANVFDATTDLSEAKEALVTVREEVGDEAFLAYAEDNGFIVSNISQHANGFISKLQTDEGYRTEVRRAVNLLADLCHAVATECGWHKKPRETGTDLMLITSEISEAMEGDRKDLMDDKLPHHKMFGVELADAVIRICDTARKHNSDLAAMLVEKLVYNTNREDHKMENREKEGGKQY